MYDAMHEEYAKLDAAIAEDARMRNKYANLINFSLARLNVRYDGSPVRCHLKYNKKNKKVYFLLKSFNSRFYIPVRPDQTLKYLKSKYLANLTCHEIYSCVDTDFGD